MIQAMLRVHGEIKRIILSVISNSRAGKTSTTSSKTYWTSPSNSLCFIFLSRLCYISGLKLDSEQLE